MQVQKDARAERFESSSTFADNRFLELKKAREHARRLNPDEGYAPRTLGEAVNLVGTCMEMCPEYEREEREYQNNVDKLEFIPGTRRIDPKRAVKAYHRPAAGNEVPPPGDIRPPMILKKTLDYLFHDILAQDPELSVAHPFLRDRTRAVRQDFTVQHDKSITAIECNERIARFHIYCLHIMRGKSQEIFSESQELEQLRKVLQTLTQFYDDARHSNLDCPNEAEFRAYYLLTHLRDPEAMRTAELLPISIFLNPIFQQALRLQSLVQRNNASASAASRGRPHNSEACINGFTRFFKAVAAPQTPFLMACLLQTDFNDIRAGALKAMKKAYLDRHARISVEDLVRLLGFDDEMECEEVCQACGIEIISEEGTPREAVLHRAITVTEYNTTNATPRKSMRLIGNKRGTALIQDIIDAKVSHQAASTPRSTVLASIRTSRPSPKNTSFSFPSPDTSLSRPASSAAVVAPIMTSPKASTRFEPFIPLTNVKPAQIDVAVKLKSPVVAQSPKVVSTFLPKPTSQSFVAPIASTSKVTLETIRKSPVSSKSKPSPASITKAKKRAQLEGAVEEIARQLIEDIVSQQTHQAAIDALSHVREDQELQLFNFNSLILDDLADHFTEYSITLHTAETLVDERTKKRYLRKYFARWKKHAKVVKEDYLAKIQKLEEIKRAASELGRGTYNSRGTPTVQDLDLSSLNLTRDVENLDLDAVMLLEQAEAETEVFWRKGTFSEVLMRHFGRMTYKSIEILIFLPDTKSAEANWFRHKLAFEVINANLQNYQTNGQSVKVRLIDPSDLLTAVLDQSGLLIFNIASSYDSNQLEKAKRQIQVLARRFSHESDFKTALLEFNWQSQADDSPTDTISGLLGSIEEFEAQGVLNVSPCTVDQQFAACLENLVPMIQRSNTRKAPISMQACLQPLFDLWLSSSERLLSQTGFVPANFITPWVNTLVKYVHRFTRIANAADMVQSLVKFSFKPKQSLSDALLQYSKTIHVDADLLDALLLLDIQEDPQDQSDFFSAFFYCLTQHIHRITAHPIQVSEAFSQNLQNLLADFETRLESQMEEASKSVRTKKKRPASITPSSNLDGSKPKRIRQEQDIWLPTWLTELQGSSAQLTNVLAS